MTRLYIVCCLVALGFGVACDKKVEVKASNSVAETKTKAPTTPKTAPKTKAVKKDTKADAPKTDSAKSGILGIGSTPVNIKDGESNVYGARFTIIEEPIALADAIKKADKSTGPYKVKAKVEKVCQKKGCWFTLKSDDVKIPIRVKMKGYAFFVPRNAMGLDAVLEGQFKKTQISKDEAQHYEDDAVKGTGKKAKQVKGPQDTYMFIASAVQISKKKSS